MGLESVTDYRMDTLFPKRLLGHISSISFNISLKVTDCAQKGDHITQKGDTSTRSFSACFTFLCPRVETELLAS
jgi:hypothetical protein